MIEIAAHGSSELHGDQMIEALILLAIPAGERFDWLNGLALFGARDGRPPIIDSGPGQAEILGRALATRESAIDVSRLHLTAVPH